MSMDVNEIRAARMYLFQQAEIKQIVSACSMTKQDVLHSIAVYKAEHKDKHPECEHCRMRSGDRPCVWPKGVCRL